MMSDNDGIDDALRNAAQMTAGMLARLGEARSRAGQQRVIDQEHAVAAASAQAEQRTRQAAVQEQAAMARLRLVHDPNWWTAATVRQVGDTWQISDAYRGRPDVDAARAVMAGEIRTRWGINPEADANSATVRQLLEQAGQDRRQQRAELSEAERDRGTAHAVLKAADDQERAQDRSLHTEAVVGVGKAGEIEQARARADSLDRQSGDRYDSAEQRRARAEGYSRSGNQRATEARILADEGNALPPTFATRTRTGRRRRPSRGPHQPRPHYRVLGDRDR